MDNKNSANIFGNPLETWRENHAKNVTFILTEDCQLRCKYCYLIGKNHSNKMNFNVAKKSIDYLLENRNLFPEKAVIWDFIGGEPFLEIELIDKISNYIKIKMFQEEHPWFNNYRFSFSTNGILYNSLKVQNYISLNSRHLSIGLTIDGSKRKHDMQRVYPNGKGSYDTIVKNVPLWLFQFPNSATKVTIAHDDLPFIKESVIHLWSLGIKNININCVFEEVWKDDDEFIFEEQLTQLADEIIKHNLYNDHTCSFYSRTIGLPVFDNNNWCGTGKMLAIGTNGDFYPCVRFAPFSLQNKKAIIIGNYLEGLNFNKLRPFLSLNMTSQSSAECIDCEVASGCSWCQGANYDFADTKTIYQRATYLCRMHKARVRANNYFWGKMDEAINKNKIHLC